MSAYHFGDPLGSLYGPMHGTMSINMAPAGALPRLVMPLTRGPACSKVGPPPQRLPSPGPRRLPGLDAKAGIHPPCEGFEPARPLGQADQKGSARGLFLLR